jgi:hypothetical protein
MELRFRILKFLDIGFKEKKKSSNIVGRIKNEKLFIKYGILRKQEIMR